MDILSNHSFNQAVKRLNARDSNSSLTGCINLNYSLSIFNEHVEKERFTTLIVYCIDSVEIRSYCQGTNKSHSEYVFNGMLDRNGLDKKTSDLLRLVDAANARDLYFDPHKNALFTRIKPHIMEVGRFLDSFKKEEDDTVFRLLNIANRLKSQQLNVGHLSRIRRFIDESSYPHQKFEEFLKDFQLVLPQGLLSFLSEKNTIKERYREISLNSNVVPLYGGNNSITNSIISRGLLDEGLFEEEENKSFIRKIYKSMHAALENINNTRKDVRKDRPHASDNEALAIIATLNEFCFSKNIDVEFRILSRSSSLLSLSGALQGSELICKVVHPFFNIENYGAKGLFESKIIDSKRDILLQMHEAYRRIGDILNPIINNIEADGSRRENGIEEYQKEVADITATLANVVSGLSLANLAREKGEGSTELKYFRGLVEGDVERGDIKNFFESLGLLLASKRIKEIVENQICRIENDFVDIIISDFVHEDETLYILEYPGYFCVRFRWGYMRPMYVFSHEASRDIFNKFKEIINTDVPSGWKALRATAIDLYREIGAARSIDRWKNDDLFLMESCLLVGIIMSSMGRFRMGAQTVSRYISELNEGIDKGCTNLAKSIAVREMLLFRHFCSRAAAFDQVLFESSGNREFNRARRDLHFAFLAQKYVRSYSINEIDSNSSFDSGFEANNLIHDPRLQLSHVGGYLEILSSCWQSENEADGMDVIMNEIQSSNKGRINLTQQKNYWALMGALQGFDEQRRQIESGEPLADLYIVRINQMRMTILLMLIINSNLVIADKVFSLREIPTRSDLLSLYDCNTWLSELFELSEKKGILCTSRHVYEPVLKLVNAFKSHREMNERFSEQSEFIG